MVACETYKFAERVQLDSITSNELGDPDALASVPLRPELTSLQDWRSEPCLGALPCCSPAVPCCIACPSSPSGRGHWCIHVLSDDLHREGSCARPWAGAAEECNPCWQT